MDWRSEVRKAVFGESENVEIAKVVVGGKTIEIPVGTKIREVVEEVSDLETVYVAINNRGEKLDIDHEIESGEKVYIIPIRVDG